MKKSFLFQALTLLIVGILTMPASAQESTDVHSELTSKFRLSLGLYYPKREYGLGLDGNLGLPEEPIDFDAAIETDEKDVLITGIFSWQFKPKWSLSLQYFGSSQDTYKSLDEEIEWEEIVYEVGADVHLGTSLEVTRLFVARHFLQDQKHDLGVGAGLHAIDFGITLEGEARIDDESTEFRSESAKLTAPLPNLGIWYRYSPSKKWLLEARLDWLDVSFDQLSGSLTDIRVSADYSFNQHFGIGLAYQLFRLDADYKSDDWSGRVEVDYKEPALNINAYW